MFAAAAIAGWRVSKKLDAPYCSGPSKAPAATKSRRSCGSQSNAAPRCTIPERTPLNLPATILKWQPSTLPVASVTLAALYNCLRTFAAISSK
jgi:hypothetical protein